MRGIKRYDLDTYKGGVYESEHGSHVLYADYAAEISRLRAEADALRAGIAKALDELDDDGPKAVKYAAQELRAAMGADA